MSSVSLESLEKASSGRRSFNWLNVLKFYKDRPSQFERLNLFKYIHHHWKSGETIDLHFFGWYDKATWPINETYAKYNLALFRPWRKAIEENKALNGAYRTTLETYMGDQEFPAKKRVQII